MIAFTSGFASRIEAMLEWRTALGYSRSTLAYPMLTSTGSAQRATPGRRS
jgi:hypothetical protein